MYTCSILTLIEVCILHMVLCLMMFHEIGNWSVYVASLTHDVLNFRSMNHTKAHKK